MNLRKRKCTGTVKDTNDYEKHEENGAIPKHENKKFQPKGRSNKKIRTGDVKTEAQDKLLSIKAEEPENCEIAAKGNSMSLSRSKLFIKTKSKKYVDQPLSPPLKYNNLGAGPEPVPATHKKYIGCHVSAANGVWNCFENGAKSKAKSIALFLRNQRSWNAKPLDEKTVEMWNQSIKDFPPHLILPHGSYLMNLGSPKTEILEKSRRLFVEELKRCETLGIPHFNFHPGSTLGEISREECCATIAESINRAHEATSTVICVIENMSKQGFTVGGDFHEIRHIIEAVKDKRRVGVCIDTCHAHAAGYDLSSEDGFKSLVSDFEKIIGWQFLRGLHLNDSKGKVGDHKDRHENIGKGHIGLEGFKRIMNYPRFNDIPLILETPFVNDDIYTLEIQKLQKLIK